MILADPSDPARRFFNFGGAEGNSLDQLPHVLATVTNAEEMDAVVKRLHAEYDEPVRNLLKGKSNGFEPQDNQKRSIFVIIDHYDDADLLSSSGLGLSGLSEVGKGHNLYFVIGGSLDILRDSSDQLRRRAESARYTLVLQDFEAVRYMGVRGDLTANQELPPGRGFLVKAISASMVHVCLPFVEGTMDGVPAEDQLNNLIGDIKKKYRKPAQWSYSAEDLGVLEAAIGAGPDAEDIVSGAAAIATAQTEAMSELKDLMSMQAELAAQFSEEIPEKIEFATVEVPADKPKPRSRKSTAKAKPKKG